jgi:hypothetical protein
MSIRSKAIAAFVAVAITTAGLGAFAVSRLGKRQQFGCRNPKRLAARDWLAWYDLDMP